MFARIIVKTIIIIAVGFQQDDAGCFFIAKQRNCLVSLFLQVAEANDIPEVFD